MYHIVYRKYVFMEITPTCIELGIDLSVNGSLISNNIRHAIDIYIT